MFRGRVSVATRGVPFVPSLTGLLRVGVRKAAPPPVLAPPPLGYGLI